MQIKINADSEIISYAVIGEVENGITVDRDVVPDNFEADFKPLYFVFRDKIIEINENYKEPSAEQTTTPIARIEQLENAVLQILVRGDV